MYCYAVNGRCDSPAHLWLTGCRGEIQTQLRRLPGFDKWFIEKESRSYIDALEQQKENLVYLTADAETVLDELDPKKIYIIGGLVDRNRWKGITMNKAKDQGISTAKLPIGSFLKMSSSQGTPTKLSPFGEDSTTGDAAVGLLISLCCVGFSEEIFMATSSAGTSKLGTLPFGLLEARPWNLQSIINIEVVIEISKHHRRSYNRRQRWLPTTHYLQGRHTSPAHQHRGLTPSGERRRETVKPGRGVCRDDDSLTPDGRAQLRDTQRASNHPAHRRFKAPNGFGPNAHPHNLRPPNQYVKGPATNRRGQQDAPYTLDTLDSPPHTLRRNRHQPRRLAPAFDPPDPSDSPSSPSPPRPEVLLRSSPSTTASATSTHVPSSSKPPPTRLQKDLSSVPTAESPNGKEMATEIVDQTELSKRQKKRWRQKNKQMESGFVKCQAETTSEVINVIEDTQEAETLIDSTQQIEANQETTVVVAEGVETSRTEQAVNVAMQTLIEEATDLVMMDTESDKDAGIDYGAIDVDLDEDNEVYLDVEDSFLVVSENTNAIVPFSYSINVVVSENTEKTQEEIVEASELPSKELAVEVTSNETEDGISLTKDLLCNEEMYMISKDNEQGVCEINPEGGFEIVLHGSEHIQVADPVIQVTSPGKDNMIANAIRVAALCAEAGSDAGFTIVKKKRENYIEGEWESTSSSHAPNLTVRQSAHNNMLMSPLKKMVMDARLKKIVSIEWKTFEFMKNNARTITVVERARGFSTKVEILIVSGKWIADKLATFDNKEVKVGIVGKKRFDDTDILLEIKNNRSGLFISLLFISKRGDYNLLSGRGEELWLVNIQRSITLFL
ncbi:hypothetical protein IFM89_039770 [Coptis chinensis]|uniref:tRNA (guanine(9)-N(1))-methyltransferase n=1 Tax=Coptis chinensis TaxID=261450 RepID=A0A835GVP6_9MAGN|nr:hypothetical protein IFM89_039770 [Coptis chinensis]